MPRPPRLTIPGIPYHITQRGLHRMTVFVDEADMHLYSRLLLKNSRDHGLKVVSYCWMPNHIHIVGIPDNTDSLARVFRRVH
jgi:putative transposase